MNRQTWIALAAIQTAFALIGVITNVPDSCRAASANFIVLCWVYIAWNMMRRAERAEKRLAAARFIVRSQGVTGTIRLRGDAR